MLSNMNIIFDSTSSNSSCRLLNILVVLPTYDCNCLYESLNHTELMRLGSCCRLLRNTICNNDKVWRKLYKNKYLSAAYHVKEWDFVLWCARTTMNNVEVPGSGRKGRRADVIDGIDWYSTYRRRVTTEANWRYGYSNTTHIQIEPHQKITGANIYSSTATSVQLEKERSINNFRSLLYYNIEFSAYRDLKYFGNKTGTAQSFSTSPNVVSWDRDNDGINYDYHPMTGDYYMSAMHFELHEERNKDSCVVTILSREHGNRLNSIDIQDENAVVMTNGKWGLIAERLQGLSNVVSIAMYDCISVIDLDQGVKCPGSIDDTWQLLCFYEVTDHSAMIYVARLTDRTSMHFEWSLYEFSTVASVRLVRAGWFYFPQIANLCLIDATYSYQSRVVIEVFTTSVINNYYVIHSVASSEQSDTPHYTFELSNGDSVPIAFLRDIPSLPIMSNITICSIDPYGSDQMLQCQGAYGYQHVIGSLYCIYVRRDHDESNLLVDIDTNEVIRVLDSPEEGALHKILSVGILSTKHEGRDMLTMHEYGAL